MDAPEAPDPKETAAAQAQMNKETAVAQYGLGATNQIGPNGTLTYKQIGNWEDGTPRFEATTTYSPEQQALYDKYTGLAGKLGDIGNNQAGAVSSTLSQPFKIGNAETESRLMDLGRTRLDPIFGQRRDALETKLRNQGIQPGSEAWSRAIDDFSRQENDAYNSLLLSGRSQAANESIAERNQPLTELMSLLSGTQPGQPQFQNTPQPGVAGVDYAGLVNQKYQADLANYQSMMGGLFGLGSAAIGGWAMSDERVKTDIRKIGKLDSGLKIYSYRYKGDDEPHVGLMAQEVEKMKPEAVATVGGVKIVNYPEAVGV